MSCSETVKECNVALMVWTHAHAYADVGIFVACAWFVKYAFLADQ